MKDRRSRLEIICDLLLIVSRGAQRPTRMMQLANLTWKDLVKYLELMLREGLLTTAYDGSKKVYSATERGMALLAPYISLRKKAANFRLEPMSDMRVTRALESYKRNREDSTVGEALMRRLKGEGFRILNSNVLGESRQKHKFAVVAERDDEGIRAYVVLDRIDDKETLRMFVASLDTGLNVWGISKGEVTPTARLLAKSYSLNLDEWKGASPRPAASATGRLLTSTAHLSGKSLLLGVDPKINYEAVVGQITNDFKLGGSDVTVFTWKGSPVYNALERSEHAELYTITASVSHPSDSERKKETLIPENDIPILLDSLDKASSTRRKLLVWLDILSDLLISFGVQKSYEFLKRALDILSRHQVTSIFILRQGTHDQTTENLIKGFFQVQLVYDAAGLKVTRS